MATNYPNLSAEMARNGVSVDDLAAALKRDRNTVYGKLKRRRGTDFRTSEAFAIRDRFFPGLTVDYLFANVTEGGGNG